MDRSSERHLIDGRAVHRTFNRYPISSAGWFYLVADATATFGKRDFHGTYFEPQLLHDTALASLHGEFAEVLTVEELLFRL